MLRSIGIIGNGYVGSACRRAFEHNAEFVTIDPVNSLDTWEDFWDAWPSVAFIAVPAPTLEDRSVDTTIICKILHTLTNMQYDGLVVLKSSVPPQQIDQIFSEFSNNHIDSPDKVLRMVYSPEFLREETWATDVLEPDMMLFGGDYYHCQDLERIYKNHSHLKPTVYRFTTPCVASLIKYSINTYLATKVVFMNQLHQLYSDINGAEPRSELWGEFVEYMATDKRIGESHMQVPHNGKKGYGGSCFPKDVSAIIGCDIHNRLTLLRDAELANTAIRLTYSTPDGKIV